MRFSACPNPNRTPRGRQLLDLSRLSCPFILSFILFVRLSRPFISSIFSKASKSASVVKSFVLPTPRFKTWKTISPGAMCAVLGMPESQQNASGASIIRPVPFISSVYLVRLSRPFISSVYLAPRPLSLYAQIVNISDASLFMPAESVVGRQGSDSTLSTARLA